MQYPKHIDLPERITIGCFLIAVIAFVGFITLLMSASYIHYQSPEQYWTGIDRFAILLAFVAGALALTALVPARSLDSIQTRVFRWSQKASIKKARQQMRLRTRVQSIARMGLYIWPVILLTTWIVAIYWPFRAEMFDQGPHEAIRRIFGVVWYVEIIVLNILIVVLLVFAYEHEYKKRALEAGRSVFSIILRDLKKSVVDPFRLAFWVMVFLGEVVVFYLPRKIIDSILLSLLRALDKNRIQRVRFKYVTLIGGIAVLFKLLAAFHA